MTSKCKSSQCNPINVMFKFTRIRFPIDVSTTICSLASEFKEFQVINSAKIRMSMRRYPIKVSWAPLSVPSILVAIVIGASGGGIVTTMEGASVITVAGCCCGRGGAGVCGVRWFWLVF
eukprot:scaffold20322_cov67-Skeletonema_dohrnii-CCMP3373.AAC.1